MEEDEFNHEIDQTPIERKMKYVCLKVSEEKYKHIPTYMQKYCNQEVYTIKDIPRIHGCGANHGTCILRGKQKKNKKIHKERLWKKQIVE